MVKRFWWVGGIVLALVLAGVLVARIWILPIHVDAPEPVVTEDVVDDLPPVPRSVLVAPFAFDLGPALAQFEADIPRQFGSLDRRLPVDGGKGASFAFVATRSPFRMHIEGTQVVLETVVEYEGRCWYDPPVGPQLSVGCGGDGDPRPRLRVHIETIPTLTPDWGLRTRTQVDVARFSDEERDRCQLTLLKFDVTRKVVGAVREELARVLAEFDADVAQFDLKAEIEELWQTVGRPIRLTDGVWLVIQPEAVQLISLSGRDDTMVAVARLAVWPKIVTGTLPPQSAFMTPLPPLVVAAAADTTAEFQVALQGILGYDAATDLMRKPLVGKVVRMAGRRVRIEDVALRGVGGGRVAFGVTLSGAVEGRIYFTGTPQLDQVTRQLTFPNLDFDVGSADLVARGLSWWRGDLVRDFLRVKAAIPDTTALAGLERMAEREMNRELTAGVRLEADLDSSRGMAVSATQEHLLVRALARGEARLVIDRVLARVGKPRRQE